MNILLYLALFLAPSPQFDIQVQRLSPRAAVFTGGPQASTVLAVATHKGIVVVDAPFTKSIGQGFRDAIQAEFKRSDFACLIVSHEHGDHVGGSTAYADIPIVGHESVPGEMRKQEADPKTQASLRELPEKLAQYREYLRKNNPKQLEEFAVAEKAWKLVLADVRDGLTLLPPTITFDRQMTLSFGDVTAKLMSFGRFHSPGDIIVSIPEENVVFTSSLFAADRLPMIGKPTEEVSAATVDNWAATLRRVVDEANSETRFINAHGPAMTKAQYQRNLAYLEKLWSEVRRAKASGKSLEQAKTELSLKESFPEVAGLKDEANRGTPFAVLNIHQRNIEVLWKAVG